MAGTTVAALLNLRMLQRADAAPWNWLIVPASYLVLIMDCATDAETGVDVPAKDSIDSNR